MADTWMDLWTGIWDNVWGVMYTPIDTVDSEYFNTQVEIYDDSAPNTLLDVIHARMEPTCLTELRAHGAGSFKVSKRDVKILENPSLIAYRKYVKIRLNGTVVGGFIIQTKKTVIVGAGEEADEMWEVSGEGQRSASRDAAVYPALGLKATSADTRYFNFATEQGAWYKPAEWSNAVGVLGYLWPNSWWGTAPAEWPDARTADWIWDRAVPYAMPQGYVYFRKEFTVATTGAHSLFFAVDDAAEVYVDGELLHTTAEHAWQETTRIDLDLEAGPHVLGIKAYNWKNDAPGGLIVAFFKVGDPLVPSSAQLMFTSDATWKIRPYPTVEPGWSIGDVLLTLLNEAKARGVRFAQNWTPNFTGSVDSGGNSWGDPIPFSFTVGATYEDVIEAIEEMGCDIYVDPDTLQVYAWKKRGSDKSIAGLSEVWSTVATNLATHGNFEIPGSATEVRRNYVLNYKLNNSVARWSITSGVSTMTPTADGAQIDIVGGPTSGPLFFSAANVAAADLDRWSGSMEITVPAGYPAASVRLAVYSYGQNSVVADSVPITVAPGETRTITALATQAVTSATTGVRLILYGNGTVNGARFIVRQPLLEKAAVPGLPFGGDQVPKLRKNWVINGTPPAWSGSGWSTAVGLGASPETGWIGGTLTTLTTPYIFTSLSNRAYVAGEKVTLSVRYRVTATAGAATHVTVRPHQRTGNIYYATAAVVRPIVVGKDEDVVIQWTTPVDIPAGNLDISILGANSAGSLSSADIGFGIQATRAQIESGWTDGKFFRETVMPAGFATAWEGTANASPSYLYDSELTTSWAGTAGDSDSILLGTGASTYPTPSTVARGLRSNKWVKSGLYSLRQIPSYFSRGSAYTEIANHASPRGLVSGQTYTLAVWFYQDAPMSVTSALQRTVAITGTTNPADTLTVQAPNVAGEQLVRLTFKVPDSGTWYIRLYNGGMAGDPETFWDDLTIVEGNYNAGTFNGSTVSNDPDNLRYTWNGTANASTSKLEMTSTSGEAIVFSPGHNLLSAEETGQAEIANTLLLHAKDGWVESATSDLTSKTRYGRVETQLSTQLSTTGASPLVQELFRTKALPEKSATFQIVSVDNMIPFLNFNVGDIVSAPGEVPGVFESRRIMSISFSENEDTGKPEFSLEFDTIFKDRQTELEKWVSRISNSSAIGGGFSNSSPLPPTSTVGTPNQPLGNVPDAPTGLVVSSLGKFGTDGSASSDFSLIWNPVVTGSGFGTLQVEQYEVWGRLASSTEDQLLAVVFDAFAYMGGFRPGDAWVFKVRAVSTSGGGGPFSPEVPLTAAYPAIVLGKPSTPALTSSMGTVTIKWDGLIAGQPAPGYVRYVRVERTGTGSTGTWEERRRNVFANPYAKTALTRFSSTGGATNALSLRTDMTAPTTTAVRSTRNATGNIRLVDLLVGTEMLAGTSYRTRVRVRSSVALTGVQVLYRPAVASTTGSVTADVMDIPAGVSYIDVVAVTHINAPSATAGVTIIHNGTDVGSTFDVTDITIEKMPSDGTMIAGNLTSADPTKRYRWLGATDNSVSVLEELDPWVAVGTLVRGSTVDASAQTGKTYDYRLVAIDTYGGESTPSDKASIVVSGVQSGDITGGLASQNLVANGSFESDLSSWIIKSIYPNGGSSAVVVVGGLAGAKYLRLIRGSEIPGAETELSVAQAPESFIPISAVGAMGYFISAKVAATGVIADGFSMRAYWYTGDKTTPASTAVSTIVDEQDVSTTAQYFVGQVFPPADARFMQVAVVSTKQSTTVYVDDVVAREVISEGMIGQGAITAPHLSAGSVTANALQAGSVTADAIAAGSILADKIGAGQIQTNHLSADVGASLDISSNASVNILINRTDTLEGDLASTQGAITDLQTYYSFTSEGAVIGKTDSAFKLFLKNDRIEILENNTVVSYWDSGQMVVKRFVGEEVVLANHKIEKYNSGTIVKKL